MKTIRRCFGMLALSAPLLAYAQAPLHVAPAPSAIELEQAALQTRPWQFAVAVPMQLDPALHGSWSQEGSEQVWRARLHSAGATSLSLHFSHWAVAPGAQLLVRGEPGQQQGPYGAGYNGRGELWTALVHGDTAELELRQPAAEPLSRFRLGAVMHGFRGAWPDLQSRQKANPAGSCNIDVACSEADGFDGPVRATVLVQISGNAACSGTLINNTAQDRRPFILTADHCGISASNQNSIVIYFNFQRPSCERGSPRSDRPPNPNQSISGAEFLADNQRSDFTLLMMGSFNDPARVNPDFNPHWAGWTRALEPAQAGAGVHHPQGDEKSIALFNTPLRSESLRDGGQFVQVWRVVWSNGTTEPGSSGSGIFGNDRLLRGQLFGGDASCTNLTGPDYYGRFSESWDASTQPRQQLAFWLDPANNNPVSLAGVDVGNTPPPSATPMPTPTVTPAPSATPTPTPLPTGGGGGGSSGSVHWLSLLLLLFCRRVVTKPQ